MKKKILTLTLALCLLLALAACGGETGGSKDTVTVNIGVVGEHNEMFDTINELLKDEGIEIKLTVFSEYKIPNMALADGDIDMNAFQHKAYLNKEMNELGYELAVLCDTIIAPLGLYSDKITAIDQLVDGDKIAVPSDPTNEGRCFKILEAAGLIEVDPAAGYTPTLFDVTANPLNLEFVEVEASQTANLLPDVAAAFVNGAHAVSHGMNPEADAILIEQVEPGSDNPYINILAVRAGEESNEVYQKIADAYHTAEVAATIREVFQGAYLPAWE